MAGYLNCLVACLEVRRVKMIFQITADFRKRNYKVTHYMHVR